MLAAALVIAGAIPAWAHVTIAPDTADKGALRNIVVHQNPEINGTRVAFQLAAGSEKAIELRAQLTRNDDPLSEVWLYRWTP